MTIPQMYDVDAIWVASECGKPQRVFFTPECFTWAGYDHIAVFSKEGCPNRSYRRQGSEWVLSY